MSDIRIATAEDQILLEKEAKYCSYGDTVHYIEPPRIFSRCEGSYVWDTSDACRAASGNCKCKSTPRNKRVLVIGDGKSDMCVSTTADFVFAKGSLAQYCQAHAIPHLRFDSFAELPALLARLPQGMAANATHFTSDTQELFHHV